MIDSIDIKKQGYNETKNKLILQKRELGQIKIIETKGNLPDSFKKIGENNSSKIKNVLEYKLGDHREEFLARAKETFERAKKIARKLEKTHPVISQSLDLYFESLESWSQGAGITKLEGCLLQDDSSGCQTILVRGEKGEIFVAHTEEWEMDFDEKQHVEITPEWTKFVTEDGDVSQSFTGYPFSLPGSSFGIHNGKIIAVDSLNVRKTQNAIPANMATWVAWNLAGKIDPEIIFEKLAPFADGYAYNEIGFDTKTQRVVAKKIEFAGKEQMITILPDGTYQYMIQSNMPTTEDVAPLSLKLNKMYRLYFKKLAHTHEAIRGAWKNRFEKGNQTHHLTLESLGREISLITSNPDLQSTSVDCTFAHMLAVVNTDGTLEMRISSGPRIPGDRNREEITVN